MRRSHTALAKQSSIVHGFGRRRSSCSAEFQRNKQEYFPASGTVSVKSTSTGSKFRCIATHSGNPFAKKYTPFKLPGRPRTEILLSGPVTHAVTEAHADLAFSDAYSQADRLCASAATWNISTTVATTHRGVAFNRVTAAA